MVPPSSTAPSNEPQRTVSRPTLVPPLLAEPAPWKVLLPLVVLFLLPRALLFPINQNLYGDAVVRTDLAERWAADPHWISSFADGAFQFGPLHLYLVGFALELGLPRTDAGRWVSLLFGVLTLFPLFAFTRRLFDWKAAAVACLALTAWGLHIQLSTTGASESLGLFLVCGLAWQLQKATQEGTFRPIFGAAVFMNLAAMTRYDTWPFIPLIALLLVFHGPDRTAGLTRGVLFGMMSLAFPLFWMHGNEVQTGSALHPIHFIDAFHREWAKNEIAWMGQLRFRLQNGFFWPGIALFTLTPLVGGFALYGFIRATVTRKQLRWLGYWVLIPTVFYAVRAALLLSFVPLGRFAVNQVVLLLPFTAYGFLTLFAERPRAVQRAAIAVSAIALVGFTAWLGFVTYEKTGRMADGLRSVAPTSNNPAGMMQVAKRVGENQNGVILDTDSSYWDLQIAFFSLAPETKLARYRWDPKRGHPTDGSSFPERLVSSNPTLLVLSSRGLIRSDPTFKEDGANVRFAGRKFRKLGSYEGGFDVYEAAL